MGEAVIHAPPTYADLYDNGACLVSFPELPSLTNRAGPGLHRLKELPLTVVSIHTLPTEGSRAHERGVLKCPLLVYWFTPMPFTLR